MSSTALFTFIIYLPSRPQKVDIYGSWDNFTRAYPMKKDTQKGSGHWTGCHAFNICESEHQPSKSTRTQGGLKQGCTYWYIYRLNDYDDYCDPFSPSTNRCTSLLGRSVNILEVPIERPESSHSTLAMSSEESAVTKKAQLKHKMLRPLFSRKRPGSASSAPDERKERARSEWLAKAVGRLRREGVNGVDYGANQAQDKVLSHQAHFDQSSQPFDRHNVQALENNAVQQSGTAEPSLLRKMSSAPSVLPSGALLPGTDAAVGGKDDPTHSIRDSLGTMSLTSASTTSMTADNAAYQTPRINQSTFDEEQSPPSLYNSATTSLDATPMSMLQTPQAIQAPSVHPPRELPNIKISSTWLDTPTTTYQPLAQPQAYSRHTLGAPFKAALAPLALGELESDEDEDIYEDKLHQHDSSSTLHPFFTQGARVSLHAAAVQSPHVEHSQAILSRADTEPDNDNDDLYAFGLGLFRQPQPEAAKKVLGLWQEDSMEPAYEIDLNAVNAKLLGVQCVTRRREEEGFDGGEFGYLKSVIY